MPPILIKKLIKSPIYFIWRIWRNLVLKNAQLLPTYGIVKKDLGIYSVVSTRLICNLKQNVLENMHLILKYFKFKNVFQICTILILYGQ